MNERGGKLKIVKLWGLNGVKGLIVVGKEDREELATGGSEGVEGAAGVIARDKSVFSEISEDVGEVRFFREGYFP